MNSKGGPLGLSVTFLRGPKLTVIGVCHQFWAAKTKEEEKSFSPWENENDFEIQLFRSWMQTKTLTCVTTTTSIWSDSRSVLYRNWNVNKKEVLSCYLYLKMWYLSQGKVLKKVLFGIKTKDSNARPCCYFWQESFCSFASLLVKITMCDYLSLNLILFHWLNNDSFDHVALCNTTWSYRWFEHALSLTMEVPEITALA